VRAARTEGIKAGLFRPITLNPFPYRQIEALSKRVKSILVVEMNTGQMLDDVQRAVAGRVPVEFFGRMGGVVPFQDEIQAELRRITHTPMALGADPRQAWMDRLGKLILN
jgi:2-oxoglutarate ferredoxin oxidoreductase subunit alpha